MRLIFITVVISHSSILSNSLSLLLVLEMTGFLLVSGQFHPVWESPMLQSMESSLHVASNALNVFDARQMTLNTMIAKWHYCLAPLYMEYTHHTHASSRKLCGHYVSNYYTKEEMYNMKVRKGYGIHIHFVCFMVSLHQISCK